MPDLPIGVEEAVASDLDVNSPGGFQAALAKQAGVEIPEGAQAPSDTDVASGLTTVEESADGQPRDERGRFAPAAPSSEESGQGAAPAEGQREEGEQLDPELAALLERHDGDPVAALRALNEEARNAQSLIGRHSAEVGEMREKLARLEGRMEEQSRVPRTVAPTLNSESLVDLVADRGGRHAVLELIQAGHDEATIERAFQTWAEYDDTPYEALAARQDYRMAMLEFENEQQQPGQPQVDPTLAEIKRERQLGAAVAAAKQGISDAEWSAIKDHLIPAFSDEQTPEIIKNAVVSDDPQTQLQGITALVQIARGRAIAAATTQANQERTEQVKQTKRAVQVGSGSLRPVQKRQPEEPQNREERIKSFHEALLRTETTSVADSLTFGK